MCPPDLNHFTMAFDLIVEINWGGLIFLYIGLTGYRVFNTIKDTNVQKRQSIVYID